MLNKKTIAVVVPCYNEETQVSRVVHSLPKFVDLIIVIDDCSTDNTRQILHKLQSSSFNKGKNFKRIKNYKITNNHYNDADNIIHEQRLKENSKYIPAKISEKQKSKLVIIEHLVNAGVGAAISSGYKYARDCQIDCTAVMAGDGQMDPSELKLICEPVVNEKAEYSKGNRLRHPSASYIIPKLRYFGNNVLSILTKVSSGYWRVSDTQTGYTAISLKTLEKIQIHKIYKSYGMPNDLLVKLNIISATVTEVPIKPIYGVGENSKMRVYKVIFTISILLFRLFFKRLFMKYLINDFHPLFLLYNFSFLSSIGCLWISYYWFQQFFLNNVMYGHLAIILSLGFFAFQSLIFAMWFDMQDNERLYV